jgi:hypothetical protein
VISRSQTAENCREIDQDMDETITGLKDLETRDSFLSRAELFIREVRVGLKRLQAALNPRTRNGKDPF